PSIYASTSPLSLHDALPISNGHGLSLNGADLDPDPAVHDRQVAGPNQLVASGHIGEGAGVHAGSVSGNLHRALTGLDIVDDVPRSEEHTSELQSRFDLVCRL